MEFQELEAVLTSESGHAGGIGNSEWAKYIYKKYLNTHLCYSRKLGVHPRTIWGCSYVEFKASELMGWNDRAWGPEQKPEN